MGCGANGGHLSGNSRFFKRGVGLCALYRPARPIRPKPHNLRTRSSRCPIIVHQKAPPIGYVLLLYDSATLAHFGEKILFVVRWENVPPLR